MISAFAHEIHHALDQQQPHQGALGPQIAAIDNATKVDATIDEK